MSKNNKNTASEAILELNSIKESLKEESKNTLKTLLGDVVRDVLRESINEEDDNEDDYDVVEGSTEDNKDEKDTETKKSGDVDEDVTDDEMSQEQPTDDMSQEDGMEQAQSVDTQEAPVDGEGEDADDWSNYSQYQTGDDNTYDLTGEEDYDKIVKVYKLMQDTDQVVVKQDGNTIQLTDGGTGAEYVIDLGTDEGDSMQGEGEEMSESVIKENGNDMAGFDDDEDDDEDVDDNEDEDKEPRFESKKSRKTMKENKELVFEVDLGYTDNYQSKDPVQGLSNTEPSKSGKSWEKGVPTGTEKPWAGSSKDKGEPFEKTVNEEEEVNECGAACAEEAPVDEGTNVGGAVQQHSNSKSHIPDNRKEHGPKVKHHVSTGGNYDEVVESYKREIAKLKKINEAYKKENRQLKECAKELGKNIQESYVVNTNLAKITRLFTENAVSQKERVDIVNRFANEAKTVEQSNALYESINNELKKNGNKTLTVEGSAPMTVESNKQLNEVKKSEGLVKTLDLIKRMGM